MKESSVNALLVFSIIILLFGSCILSPDGRLFFLVFAGLVAGVAMMAGKSWSRRMIAMLTLLVALGFAVSTYSEFRILYERFKTTRQSTNS